MTRIELLKMQKHVMSKMLAAIAMLLVSVLLLSGVTYAWFSISRAPEASGMASTVTGNGALEIALQSPDSSNVRRAEIKSARSAASMNADQRNKTWGNVINMESSYGLDSFSLYPSRLNVISASNSVNTNGYLSVPSFGTDGRMTGLNGTKFLTYNETGANASFTEGRTYGVNILGTVADEVSASETVTYHYRRSLIRDEAAGYLEQYRSDLRNEVISLLEEQEVGIFNLLLRATQLLNSSGEIISGRTWTDDNVATAKAIIKSMNTIVRNSEVSLKWALLARAVADNATYPPNDETAKAALGTLYRNFLTYPLTVDGEGTSIRSIAETNGYTDIVDAIDSILRSERQLVQAYTYIMDDSTVSNACLLIIDVQNTLLKNGSEIESDPGEGNPATGTPRTLYAKEGSVTYGLTYNASHNVMSDYLYFVGATPGPTFGLFSIMADLLGDYQTTEQAYFSARPTGFYDDSNNGARKQYTLYIRATGKNGSGSTAAEIAKSAVSKFNVSTNRGVLGTVYDDIMSYDPGNAMISFSIEKRDGTAYGYSIDLAFRSNERCDLLLQKKPTDRIVGDTVGEETNASTMGAGSNAAFTLSGDLIGAQSDDARDLIKNVFVVLVDTDSGAILGLICADETNIVLEQANSTLSVYEPAISPTGIISRGAKRTTNVITSLSPGVPAYVTAIVFLNGDTLPPGAVAATQQSSLYGTLNLQFASSLPLVTTGLGQTDDSGG